MSWVLIRSQGAFYEYLHGPTIYGHGEIKKKYYVDTPSYLELCLYLPQKSKFSKALDLCFNQKVLIIFLFLYESAYCIYSKYWDTITPYTIAY